MIAASTRYFGKAVVAALSLAALSACAMSPQPAREFSDPAVQRLFNASIPEYYAALNIAGQIAKTCPRYTYDSVLDLQVNERRNVEGRGSREAMTMSRGIELETAVARRSFNARHGVDLDLGRGDLCAAADAEAARQSAIAAVLVPTG